MSKKDRKNLSTTKRLVVEHCEQVIEFSKETTAAIADKSKHKKLATITKQK